MKILVTGGAGFIGFHVCKLLLSKKHKVITIDNLNSYYDINLKKARLKELKKNINNKNFKFYKTDLCNFDKIKTIFKKEKFDKVIHLAAQAGVRFSLKHPRQYIQSNIVAFFNTMELSKIFKIKHFIYASSSSVYGANIKLPYSEKEPADHPTQLYAATKRSNEIMAHSYSALYNLPTSGLRFFTAYGPWGRPDMALFLFTKNILDNKKINVFNYGNHSRDFTYIDDIADAIEIISRNIPKKISKKKFKKLPCDSSFYPFEIYNIGNGKKIPLMNYIKLVEKYLNLKAKINFLPLQKGDIEHVKSTTDKLYKKFNFVPKTDVRLGIKKFVNWYLKYYN
jgi:UDP-glucuronate 4-epimerase